jgi:hypothetical protein
LATGRRPSRISRFFTFTSPVEALQFPRPCRAACQKIHVCSWYADDVLVVRIVEDEPIRDGLADELARCYPQRRPRAREPHTPPPALWPILPWEPL